MPQVLESALPGVTVSIVPEMLHAAAPAAILVPCTCAMQPCHFADVSVAVQEGADDIAQLSALPSKCCGFTQLSSESRCAKGCRVPPDQFALVATLPL